ncbi:MAG: tRNA 2-selenouridine(34) synthase MnmH [Gammaproteobacteria bacterium]|nr:tRNA 2-selenouridine(34) synthase MnmH [Gammaproteobacteria bacterium]
MIGSPESLLRDRVPLIDLRAPLEFARGAFPHAVNLPLLSDAERRDVGNIYKQSGQQAAIECGNRLVSGAAKLDRIARWTKFIDRHPDAWLYCWRGGLRSVITQSWLKDVGYEIPRVAGGYKTLRQTCLQVLASAPRNTTQWLVLAGRTGTGKTVVINTLGNAIDLEDLANHRGSSFGGHTSPQPTPIDFENALAARYLRHTEATLVLEDESRTIGRLALPESWYHRMSEAPLVVLEASIEARAEHIRCEYVEHPLSRGEMSGELQTRLTAALDRIQKRLGGDRHRQVHDAMTAGFDNGEHGRWIGMLLEWYYDPMYDYQLQGKRSRIVFRGDRAAVTDYLQSQ